VDLGAELLAEERRALERSAREVPIDDAAGRHDVLDADAGRHGATILRP
jgi:hypothetical protein